MRALVCYESMFGNTAMVADAIAEGLSATIETQVVEVGAAPQRLDGHDLVVVGGPTHAFGMSRASTREDAGHRGATHDTRVGIREWLAALAPPATSTAVAAFDTRIDKTRVPGSAARAAEKRLRRLGYGVLAPATSFYVRDVAGPLAEGELERARRWGQQLAVTLAPTSPAGAASRG